MILINLSQKLKTRGVENSCNPEWDDELTLGINDPNQPVILVSLVLDLLEISMFLCCGILDLQGVFWLCFVFPCRKCLIRIHSLRMTRWEMRK